MLLGLAVAFLLLPSDKAAFDAIHDAALQRARVWEEPAVPIEEAKLDRNPESGRAFGEDAIVECRFVPGGVAGTTPKFECELPDGEHVKVKYGRSNPEVYTEVAATRLLTALGFPADRMFVVSRVRCFGCPADPFPQLECLNDLPEGGPMERCFPSLDYSTPQDFDDAVIERPVKGRRIEYKHDRGWTFEELKFVDAVKGGSTRAEVDALRLLAVFLGHWDNKAKNQRLLCAGEKKADDAGCEHPVAMIQDLGATFGPLKLDLAHWAAHRIWADAAACRISMHAMPYGGSTFPDAYVSEEGRQFLASRLTRLSDEQIHALFDGAKFTRYPHRRAAARNIDNWVRAFRAKVRAIADRPACPGDPTPTATQAPTVPHR